MTLFKHTSFAPLLHHKLGLIAFAGIALLASGCTVSTSNGGNAGGSGGSGGSTPNPVGPVAKNASQAFPDKPASVPAISAKEILQACATDMACKLSGSKYTQQDRMNGTALCVGNVTWSAERAIPVSDLTSWNERAEFYVGCVNQHAGDCSAVAQCSSGRDSGIYCEEDGCRDTANPQVTCQGSVATIDGTQRDCARAYATCDASSPTGCTDRHFTACPAGQPHVDRCDGNVRLGCDSNGQVSYHDCSRMGGTCGTMANGHQGCVYTEGTADPGCADGTRMPACSGSTLSACVNGRLVNVDAPELCGATP